MDLSDCADAVDKIDRTAALMLDICRAAWNRGLMAGFSGNASALLGPETVLITAAGTAKGRLERADCLTLKDGRTACGRMASSESGMHLAIYRACPHCRAILHTHPPNMQALNITLARHKKNPDNFAEVFLNLPLFEASMWRKRLFMAPSLPPGSNELALAAAAALPETAALPCAVWLESHGLCALAETLGDALALTEELEHLASVQLLALSKNGAE